MGGMNTDTDEYSANKLTVRLASPNEIRKSRPGGHSVKEIVNWVDRVF